MAVLNYNLINKKKLCCLIKFKFKFLKVLYDLFL